MATSMLRSGFNKAKRAKNHVEEGLEKVRSKPWAEPLGKALEVSSKIVGAVDGFVPGANIIGGALSFGATLLNPEPSVEDLHKQLKEIQDTIEGSSNTAIILALEKAKQEFEDKIANPVGEIKVEFTEVHAQLRMVWKEVGDHNKNMTDEVSKLKDIISRTFRILVDSRFKVTVNPTSCLYYSNHFLRTASRPLTQRTPCSSGSVSRISSNTPLSCKPALPRTSTL